MERKRETQSKGRKGDRVRGDRERGKDNEKKRE